jgi:hypothetical protein
MKKRTWLGLLLASAGVAAVMTRVLPGLMQDMKKRCMEECCPPETGAKKKSHPSKSKRKQKKA